MLYLAYVKLRGVRTPSTVEKIEGGDRGDRYIVPPQLPVPPQCEKIAPPQPIPNLMYATWVLGVGWTISVQKEAHVTFVLVKVLATLQLLSSMSSTSLSWSSPSRRRRVEFFKRLCMDLIPS